MAYYTDKQGSCFEVFEFFSAVKREGGEHFDGELEDGWYWWPCQPGCMPDCDGDPPVGPFETEQLAVKNLNEFCGETEVQPL